MEPAPVTTPRPTTSDEQSIVENFLAALDALDIDGMLALIADDIVYENVGLPTIRGRATFERAMRRFAAARGTGLGIETHRVAAHGSSVLTERTDTLELGPVAAAFWVCGTFEVRDGRIVLWRDHFDRINVAAAFARGAVRALADRVRGGR